MKQLNIGMGTAGIPFNGHTTRTKSLGGSETAMLYAARALAKRGHRVKVYTNTDRPGVYDDVEYQPLDALNRQAPFIQFDVFISSRMPVLLTLPFRAGLKILWLHDIFNGNPNFIMAHSWAFDEAWALSDFHIDGFCKATPEIRPYMWRTSNGIDLEEIEANLRPKVPGKLIYASRPERGMHVLLEGILPQLIHYRPDLRLYYATYQVGPAPEGTKELFFQQRVEHLLPQFADNVMPMGGLSKAQLYQEMSSAEMLLYPSTWPESSCITAMEAMACGTPIVSTDDYAISETVPNGVAGVLVHGSAYSKEYHEEFVRTVRNLWDNPVRLGELSRNGPKVIEERGYTWDRVVEKWVDRIEKRLVERWQTSKVKVLQEMERVGDLVPAREIAETDGMMIEAGKLAAKAKEAVDPRPQDPMFIAKTTGRYDQLINYVIEKCPRPARVLEFGCVGSPLAAIEALAAKKMPSAEFVLYDPDSTKLQNALEGCALAGLDAKALSGLDAERFDVVFLGDGIEMHEDPFGLLAAAQALLKPGGWLAWCSRLGTRSPTVPRRADRLWNLTIDDYREAFEGNETFGARVVAEDPGQTMDVIGHWLCVVQPKKAPVRPDVAFRKYRTRPHQTLAVCMIAKDEEENLRRCLNSFRGSVDEIHIALDDRTTDRTEEIAEELGATVHRVTFEDFAQIRNASLEGVTADWILWIDADEVLLGSRFLRKYLDGPVMNGFVIRQNHMYIDVPPSHDKPIRLYRNKPGYRFVGCIHEHAEDRTDPSKYDVPIAPALELSDVDIAHYGYPNERMRRFKCSARNMELLLKDVEENGKKGRMITWALVMRDYINVVQWNTEATQGAVQPGSYEYDLLCATVATYLDRFEDSGTQYKGIAYGFYQKALSLLARSGLPYWGKEAPPVEVISTLVGSIGGVHPSHRQTEPEAVWFVDGESAAGWAEAKAKTLRDKIQSSFGYLGPAPAPVPARPTPEPAEMLRPATKRYAYYASLGAV